MEYAVLRDLLLATGGSLVQARTIAKGERRAGAFLPMVEVMLPGRNLALRDIRRVYPVTFVVGRWKGLLRLPEAAKPAVIDGASKGIMQYIIHCMNSKATNNRQLEAARKSAMNRASVAQPVAMNAPATTSYTVPRCSTQLQSTSAAREPTSTKPLVTNHAQVTSVEPQQSHQPQTVQSPQPTVVMPVQITAEEMAQWRRSLTSLAPLLTLLGMQDGSPSGRGDGPGSDRGVDRGGGCGSSGQ